MILHEKKHFLNAQRVLPSNHCLVAHAVLQIIFVTTIATQKWTLKFMNSSLFHVEKFYH